MSDQYRHFAPPNGCACVFNSDCAYAIRLIISLTGTLRLKGRSCIAPPPLWIRICVRVKSGWIKGIMDNQEEKDSHLHITTYQT